LRIQKATESAIGSLPRYSSIVLRWKMVITGCGRCDIRNIGVYVARGSRSAHEVMRRIASVSSTAGQTIVIVLATLVVFDLLAYLLLPGTIGVAHFAPAYRHSRELRDGSLYAPEGAGRYPRYYHAADGMLGFDISPRTEGVARISNDQYQYHIFSNDLGCFSHHQRADYETGRPYVYFAGDSFTWGYAAYASKFATVWEKLTGVLAAQCGVTHTGQRHQFDKFNRVIQAIGVMPAVVVVGFNATDPANDAAYPHTTIIDGYEVDTVHVKDQRLVRADRSRLERFVGASVQDVQRKNRSTRGQVVNFFKVYSLSANILNRVLRNGADVVRRMTTTRSSSLTERDARSEFGATLYTYFTADDTRNRYSTDRRADANKAAILRWRDHAAQNGYRLIFLLIPWKDHFGDRTYFAQVASWMTANGVSFIDLTPVVTQSGMSRDQLYWQFDPHFNEAGNRMLGTYLAGLPELKPGAVKMPTPVTSSAAVGSAALRR